MPKKSAPPPTEKSPARLEDQVVQLALTVSAWELTLAEAAPQLQAKFEQLKDLAKRAIARYDDYPSGINREDIDLVVRAIDHMGHALHHLKDINDIGEVMCDRHRARLKAAGMKGDRMAILPGVDVTVFDCQKAVFEKQ